MSWRTGLMVALVLAACGRSDDPGTSVGGAVRDGDPGSGRRVPEPSPEAVRAIPPHEIRADGVGPYRLGAQLRDILSRLRHGPRVELLQIEGIADYSLVRAEGKKIVIGVQKPKGVTFVTVLGASIARTEKEVGVGTSLEELVAKHGDRLQLRSYAADPGVFRPSRIPQVRFVVENKRVRAVVVGSAPVVDDKLKPSCKSDELLKGRADVIAAARLGAEADITFGCLAKDPFAIVRKSDRVQLMLSSAGRVRRGPATTVQGLSQVGAVDVDGDGRDEVFAVSEARSGKRRTVSIEVFATEPQRLTSLVNEPVYSMEDDAAAWIGVRPRDVRFLIEVEARGGVMSVFGLYVHSDFTGPNEVVPLTPVSLVVRQRRMGDPPAGQGPARIDAGVGRKTSPSDAAAPPK